MEIQGLPPQHYSLKQRGKRHSATGIMSTEGIEDVFITDESVDGEVFLFFGEKPPSTNTPTI